MAEVLGVVASGIAVAQAAQTVGSLVLSLSRLWKEVKNVPDTIQNLLEELELSGKLVSAIETELGFPGPGAALHTDSSPTSVQDLAIQRCREAHHNLRSLVNDLSADLAASKKRKSFVAKAKAVLKKDTLESYEKRLHKALRFLESAIQLQLASSMRRQPELVAAEVTSVLAHHWQGLLPPIKGDSANPAGDTNVNGKQDEDHNAVVAEHSRMTVRKSGWHKTITGYSSALFGSLWLQYSETEEQYLSSPKMKSHQAHAYRVQVAPPRWLLSKAWDLQLSLACSGWTAHFRQYAVVPMASDILRVVKNGTVEEMLEMFADGRATPFTTDPGGLTLLHYAMLFQWEFVKPLVRLGLDFTTQLGTFSTPADAIVMGATLDWGSDCELAVHRSMLSQGVYDNLIGCTDSEDDSDLQFIARIQMLRCVEVFESFHTHVFPDFYLWPLEDRFQQLRYDYLSPFARIDPKAFCRFLRPDGQLQPDDLRWRVQSMGRNLAQAVIYEIFKRDIWIWYPPIARWHWNSRAELYGVIGSMRQKTMHRGDVRLLAREILSVMEPHDLTAECLGTGNTVLVDGILLWRDTLAGSYIRSCNRVDRRLWKVVLQTILRAWLEDLKAGGHDLEAYGAAEAAAFGDQHAASCLSWPPASDTREEGGYKWRGFRYGPRPEDWDLIWEWDPPVGELVGSFWTAVEEPIVAVPGAWIDDDDDGNDDDEDEEVGDLWLAMRTWERTLNNSLRRRV